MLLVAALVAMVACTAQAGEPSEPSQADTAKPSAAVAEDGSQAAPPQSTPIPTASDGDAPTDATPIADVGMPSCGEDDELLSVSPLAYDDYRFIVPLGLLSPPGHTFPAQHVYFHIAREGDSRDHSSPTREVPLRAPADATITRISTDEYLSSDPPTIEYDVYFSPCREFEGYFFHVASLAPALAEAFGPPYDRCTEPQTKGQSFRKCESALAITVSAGDVIGTTGGRHGQLDFGARDTRKPTESYARADRWRDDIYLVCPFDHYPPALQEEFAGRMGGESLARTIEPVCGQVAQDVAGTAQGAWIEQASDRARPDDRHLALAHDNVDPALGVFSIGTAAAQVGLSVGVYYFDPVDEGTNNRRFAQVTPGEVYCYDTERRVGNRVEERPAIVVAMPSLNELRLGRLTQAPCGAGPWAMDSFVTYIR